MSDTSSWEKEKTYDQFGIIFTKSFTSINAISSIRSTDIDCYPITEFTFIFDKFKFFRVFVPSSMKISQFNIRFYSVLEERDLKIDSIINDV